MNITCENNENTRIKGEFTGEENNKHPEEWILQKLENTVKDLETILAGREQANKDINGRRISKDKELNIIKEYKRGRAIQLITLDLGVSRSTIYRVLKRNNQDIKR